MRGQEEVGVLLAHLGLEVIEPHEGSGGAVARS